MATVVLPLPPFGLATAKMLGMAGPQVNAGLGDPWISHIHYIRCNAMPLEWPCRVSTRSMCCRSAGVLEMRLLPKVDSERNGALPSMQGSAGAVVRSCVRYASLQTFHVGNAR